MHASFALLSSINEYDRARRVEIESRVIVVAGLELEAAGRNQA